MTYLPLALGMVKYSSHGGFDFPTWGAAVIAGVAFGVFFAFVARSEGRKTLYRKRPRRRNYRRRS